MRCNWLVGLVVPNLVRFLDWPDYRMLIPVSLLQAVHSLLIVDTIARTFFIMEIPLGIIISLIGGPLYVWLLARQQGEVEKLDVKIYHSITIKDRYFEIYRFQLN